MIVLPAAAILCAALHAAASESSSKHYSNVSAGAGQTAGTTPPATLHTNPPPRAAAPVAAAPNAPAATPQPPKRPDPRWLFGGIAVALAAAYVLRRRDAARKRASSETLALAAHELQSPLAAIESYLDLMACEAPTGGADARRWLEDLGHMRTTTSHLRRTIGDMLDMTRVEDGRLKLAPKPVALGPLLETAAAAYTPHAASRGVKLELETAGAGVVALADPDRLRQALDNLIGNALKFTPSGRGVRVRARLSGGKAVIEVEDEGVGVPEIKRGRLFGKFQRLGPSLDGTEGTGLGLHLSRRLMEAQGGSLDYAPSSSGGSLFRITLPKAEAS